MQSQNHPEVIIFGLESRIASAIVAEMYEHIRAGNSFAEPGIYPRILRGEYPIGVRHVHPSQHPVYLGYAMGYCRFIGRWGELETIQVFWPDDNNKFPFDVGCDIDVFRRQPRIDIPLTDSERKDFERYLGDL